MELLRRPHWVFDMDGTLTEAVHDFDAIRESLGIAPGRTILEALAERPEAERAPLLRRLDAIELELAAAARPQPGAEALLERLHAGGARLGILTRNRRGTALATLRAARLDTWFATEFVLGRDEADPKPSPAGVRQLLRAWGGDAASGVMVGDYVYDLQAGRGAGVATVYLDPTARFEHAAHADWGVRHLGELLAGGALRAPRPRPEAGAAGAPGA